MRKERDREREIKRECLAGSVGVASIHRPEAMLNFACCLASANLTCWFSPLPGCDVSGQDRSVAAWICVYGQ
jgi:hypothetical protein